MSAEEIIVVTDLDGSLLDHHTYSYAAAEDALALLNKHAIPLILNSSKTAAEIKELRISLNNHFPYIVENGAGIYLEDNELIKFGIERNKVLETLKQLRQEYNFKFTSFADMSIAELADNTGLSAQAAELAKQRDFTEPLQWQDNEAQYDLLCSLLVQENLSAVKGGRFVSISSAVNKGKALQWLRKYYSEKTNKSIKIIALGDGENDLPMLEEADHPILIRSPAHSLPSIKRDELIITNELGPEGWNNSLIELIQTLNIR